MLDAGNYWNQPSKEGSSEAEEIRMEVDRTGTGTIDRDNKGRNRTGAADIDKKKITADRLCTGAGQIVGGGNATQKDNGTIRPKDEENRQHQSITRQQNSIQYALSSHDNNRRPPRNTSTPL